MAAAGEPGVGVDPLPVDGAATLQPGVEGAEHDGPAAPRDGHGEVADEDDRVARAGRSRARGAGRAAAGPPPLQRGLQLLARARPARAGAEEPDRGRLQPAGQGRQQAGPDPDPLDGEQRLGAAGRPTGTTQRTEPGAEGPVDLHVVGQLHRPEPGPELLEGAGLDPRVDRRPVDGGVERQPGQPQERGGGQPGSGRPGQAAGHRGPGGSRIRGQREIPSSSSKV